MTHPTHEQLTEFLYEDELDPARRAEVGRHVDGCAACRATLDAWRGVRANLATWSLPASGRPAGRAAHAAPSRAGLRWAAAAAVLLGSGYGLARLTQQPAVDLAALRADLVREVRHEVRQEVAAELKTHAARQAQWQDEFQEAVVDVINQLETRQVASYATLRRDVETVALRSHEEYSRLAEYALGDAASGGVDAPAVEQ